MVAFAGDKQVLQWTDSVAVLGRTPGLTDAVCAKSATSKLCYFNSLPRTKGPLPGVSGGGLCSDQAFAQERWVRRVLRRSGMMKTPRWARVALLLAAGCSGPHPRPGKIEPPLVAKPDAGVPVRAVGEPASIEPEDQWIAYGFRLVREREPLDQEWAPRIEHILKQRFENTPDRRLVAVECRRMTCLIAFIIRPPERPEGPHVDWAGIQYGTTWQRSDGWIDVYIVNKRHPMDRPDAAERVASHSAPNWPEPCRSGRRGYDITREHRECFLIGTGLGAGPLCFRSEDAACRCGCSRVGLVQSACQTNEAYLVRCSGPPQDPDWKVEHFPPLRSP